MHQHDQLPHPPAPTHHLLVADDDASTRQFFEGALGSLGYRVTVASCGSETLDLARAHRYDALLLDCRMPIAGAAELFAALRGDPTAASRDAVFLATSAEVPASLRASLLGAGFVAVIEKPCLLRSLEHALAATLGLPPHVAVLDDAKGLAATGDEATLQALRDLFRDELIELRGALDALMHQPDELVDRLHRLRSACGFCGTARLGAQARALQGHVLETRAVVPAARQRFQDELIATLAALAQPGVSAGRATL